MSLIYHFAAFTYSTLALVEIAVLMAAAIAILFVVLRGIYRALFGPKTEKTKLKPEDLQQLKRAGQSGFY
jgi:hypothetical protein